MIDILTPQIKDSISSQANLTEVQSSLDREITKIKMININDHSNSLLFMYTNI